MRGTWVVALLLMILRSAHAQEATPARIDWVRRNAIVFDTVKAGHGFRDLQPLKRLVGEARIVALGEPTHGSREVFQMKHRLLEFLVEEMGFSVFSIEANMPESFRVNDYVLRGEGSTRELIHGMYFWTWATEEVRDMVEWMRHHNAEPDASRKGPRVTFTGFDVQTPDVATKVVTGFVEKADPGYAPIVRKAARTARAAGARTASGPGLAKASFPVERARGKRLVYRGWIRAEDLRDGHAGLWWSCGGVPLLRGFDDMQDRGPSGTTDWQRFESVTRVPDEATSLDFGVRMSGRGRAWFDGLEILLDGEPADTPALDLDFEGRRLTGFATPSSGYMVRLDAGVAKTGRQSLRIEDATPRLTTSGGDPLKAAELWRSVVAHLERKHEEYGKRHDPRAVDWAIVNARLVLDSMEVREDGGRSGRAVRDRAMARMVQWILDQTPQARVVLWAHNSHVARQPRSMGRFLEEQFPGQMVVLGFATGEGSYRARSMSGKGLTDHGLQSPPVDSYERIFQTTGLPRFILDLRTAVAGSPDSGWLAERRLFRAIGATRATRQFFPLTIRDAFDGIVWIDRTSAALPLSR